MRIDLTREKGITLVALIITIVILIILAAVTIGMVLNDGFIDVAINGTPNYATEQYREVGIISELTDKLENQFTKIQLKKELENAIEEVKKEKEHANEVLTKSDIVDKLNTISSVVNYTDEIIEGEYKDYQYIVDEKNNVTIGGKLTGAKPTVRFEKSTDENGVEKLDLTVIGEIEEGEIELIESLDGLNAKSGDNTAGKVYEITKNGDYRFKVVGKNKRMAIEKISINNLIQVIESESILAGMEEIKNSGQVKMKVTGKTNAGVSESLTYTLDVIYYNGDLNFGNTLKSGDNEVSISGLSYANNTWTIGKNTNVNTATVVLKVDGKITIGNGITLTSVRENKAGPLGMIIYSSNDLELNGTISMNERGSAAKTENVYLFKEKAGTFKYVRSDGAKHNPNWSGVGPNATDWQTRRRRIWI